MPVRVCMLICILLSLNESKVMYILGLDWLRDSDQHGSETRKGSLMENLDKGIRQMLADFDPLMKLWPHISHTEHALRNVLIGAKGTMSLWLVRYLPAVHAKVENIVEESPRKKYMKKVKKILQNKPKEVKEKKEFCMTADLACYLNSSKHLMDVLVPLVQNQLSVWKSVITKQPSHFPWLLDLDSNLRSTYLQDMDVVKNLVAETYFPIQVVRALLEESTDSAFPLERRLQDEQARLAGQLDRVCALLSKRVAKEICRGLWRSEERRGGKTCRSKM